MLVPLAMGWTCLYAFAVGAAAFAGERETGTLRLLDMLPAPRRVVWAGKVSFAIVSTIGLAAAPPGAGRARRAGRGSPGWRPRVSPLAHGDAGPSAAPGAGVGAVLLGDLPSALLAAVAAIVLTVAQPVPRGR